MKEIHEMYKMKLKCSLQWYIEVQVINSYQNLSRRLFTKEDK